MEFFLEMDYGYYYPTKKDDAKKRYKPTKFS